MAVVVVPHDVVEVDRRRDTRPLVQFSGIGPKVGIVDDPLPVALEVQVIDQIKAKEGGDEPPVGFGDPAAH